MKTSSIVWALIVIAAMVGIWYFFLNGSASDAQGPSNAMGLNGSANQGNLGQTDNGAPQQPSGSGSSVSDNVALGMSENATLGTYLIGYTGMTVYTTTKDTGSTSNCYDTCAQNWPPYIVAAADVINLQPGVNGTTGTTLRTDGSLQLTYNGKPLYFYVGDKTASDAKGNGVGGVWAVAKP